MYKDNVEIDKISKYSGLSLEEVNEIINNK